MVWASHMVVINAHYLPVPRGVQSCLRTKMYMYEPMRQ